MPVLLRLVLPGPVLLRQVAQWPRVSQQQPVLLRQVPLQRLPCHIRLDLPRLPRSALQPELLTPPVK